MSYDPTKTIAINEQDFDTRLKALESKANAPSLTALLLSTTSATVGVAFSANVSGATAGSMLTVSGLPAGLTLNSAARTVTGAATTAGNASVTVTETLAGATGSPKSSTIAMTVAAAPSSSAEFTMTQLATPNRIYQRSSKTGGGANAGKGSIPVTLTVTKAGSIYARTRSTATGNVILQSSFVAVNNAPVASGPVEIAGLDARPEEFFLDLSPDGTTWKTGTVPVGMGKLIAYGGQSLMEAMLVRRDLSETMASAGETPTTLGRICHAGEPWATIRDVDQGAINSAGFNALIRLQASKEGCLVGLVGYAQGATAISQWVPGGDCWAKFIASINATGNRVESAIWMQGHSDSTLQTVTGYYYRKQLSTMFDALDAAVSDKTYTRYVATIPNISVNSWGPEYKKETVRIAGQRWCEEHPRAVSVVMDDLHLNDGVHQSQRGAVQTAVNFHRHMVNPATAIGATMGKATVAGAVVTVPLGLPTGATGYTVTGDLKSRLAVYPRSLRDPAQARVISSVALGAAVNGSVPLVITLSADPGYIDLDVIFNPKNDPAHDGSAIVLRNDLVGDGANYGRQVTAARPIRYAQPRAVTLGYNAGFGDGRWTGRKGLNAGFASYGLLHSNWAQGYTVECWLKHNGSGGTNVFMQPAGIWLAVDGTKFILNGGSSVDNALPENQWNHVAMTMDSGVVFIHINGVSQFQPGPPGSQYPENTGTGIRGFQNGGFSHAAGAATVSDYAVFSQSMYGSESFAVPIGPYAGNEPFLDHYYKLDGDGADSVIRS